MVTSEDFRQMYAETLDLQAQLVGNETREVLLSLPQFRNAKTFLDAGCGTGSQAEVLKDLLTDKQYLGIDISENHIARARKRFNDSFAFQVADVMHFGPAVPFDFALSFAVFQHLPDIKKGLFAYAGFLRPGGILVVFDANQNTSCVADPPLPELEHLFLSMNEKNSRGKRKTTCLEQIKAHAPVCDFKVIQEKPCRAEILNSRYGKTFEHYITNISQIASVEYGSSINQKRFLDELSAWRNSPAAYLYLTGGSWLILERGHLCPNSA